MHVGVDEWFTALLLCAFGFAARYVRTAKRSRSFSLVAAIVFGCLFEVARQNAVPATLVFFVTLGALCLPRSTRHLKSLACAIGIVATVGVMLLSAGVQWALNTQSLHPAQAFFTYDLALLSKQKHEDLFPKSIVRFSPKETLRIIDTYTNTGDVNTLFFSPKYALFPFPLEGKDYQILRSAWESSVVHDPVGYLRERLAVASWLLSIGQPSYWIYDPPNAVSQFPPKFGTLDHDGINYLTVFSLDGNYVYGDFLYDVWIYSLVLVVAIPLLLRGRLENRVVAGLAVATLLYTVFTVFSVPGVAYRYGYPVVAVGTVLIPILLARRFGLRKTVPTAPQAEYEPAS